MADGIGGIASSIGEIVSEGLKKGAKGVKQEIKKTAAAGASQVMGQTYTAKQDPHKDQEIRQLKAKDDVFKTQELSKAREELKKLQQPQAQETSPQKTLVNPGLAMEHHATAQKLDQPTEEEIQRRREEQQQQQLELEEKQRKDEEEKQKQAQLVVPQGKQSGPNFGKASKKPMQVVLEQTKTESKHGVGG